MKLEAPQWQLSEMDMIVPLLSEDGEWMKDEPGHPKLDPEPVPPPGPGPGGDAFEASKSVGAGPSKDAPAVPLSHFTSQSNPERHASFSLRHPSFQSSSIYEKNPTGASSLMRFSSALSLTDSHGRIFWDAGDERNANINHSFTNRMRESLGFDQDTDHILVARNNNRTTQARMQYTSFPVEGSAHTFVTHRPPPGVEVSATDDQTMLQRQWNVSAVIVHRSWCDQGARSRQMCYLHVRGPFQYAATEGEEGEINHSSHWL